MIVTYDLLVFFAKQKLLFSGKKVLRLDIYNYLTPTQLTYSPKNHSYKKSSIHNQQNLKTT